MTVRYLRLLVTSAAVAALCGCQGILDSTGEGRRLGVISFYHDPIVIEVPDTVLRSQDFVVRIRTYGGGCVRQGPTQSSVSGLRASVTPYDIHSGGGVCTADLRLFEHEATLRFDRVGVATVKFRGMRRPEDDVITEERTVVVR